MGFCLFEADVGAAVESTVSTCVVGNDGFGLSLGLATNLSVFYAQTRDESRKAATLKDKRRFMIYVFFCLCFSSRRLPDERSGLNAASQHHNRWRLTLFYIH